MAESIIQTLCFKAKNIDPIQCHIRFLSPEFHWMSWTLSCLKLKNLYGKVNLFTNKYGNEILINRLGLPYDYVNLILDDCEIPEGIDVLPKIYTYSFQDKPFIHFDGDVFIWEKLSNKLTQLDVFVQNKEKADKFYRSIYKGLSVHDVWLPKSIIQELSLKDPVRVLNTGIIGANDLDFVKHFVRESFRMIENNYARLPLLANGDFNLTYEQHLLYCMARQRNATVGFYLEREIEDLSFEGFANFQDVPYQNKFIHLLGLYKRDEQTCMMLARRLRNDYPDYFYRIIEECRKANVKLYLDYYNDPELTFENGKLYKTSAHRTDWDMLYSVEQTHYYCIDKAFSSSEVLFDTVFQLNNQMKQIKAKSNYSDNTTLLIQIPYSQLKDFRSLECDELDSLLIKLLALPMKFSQLIYALKIYFNEKEIEKEYASYIQLITLRLRYGCEQNLYFIVN